MFRRIVLCLGLSLGIVATCGSMATAGTAVVNLPVSMVVAQTCTVAAAGIDFGTLGIDPSLSTGTIIVTCQSGVPYSVALDQGADYQPPIGRHAVSNGGLVHLRYELYSDAARTQIWGDNGFASTYTTGFPVSQTGNGTPQSLPVYGATFGGVFPGGYPAGTYQDQVTVTVHF
jgi:spore coat protein U-like protein